MRKDIRNTIIASLFVLVLVIAVVVEDKLSTAMPPDQAIETTQAEKPVVKEKEATQQTTKQTAKQSTDPKTDEQAKRSPKKEETPKTNQAKVQAPVATAQPAPVQTAAVTSQPKASDNATANRGTSRSDEIYWLARIVQAEAEGENYVGKVAVANVIINRVHAANFPNSVYGVIFDRQHGYTQFSPVLDGRIYNNPSAECYQAAQAAFNGQRPVGSALYFLNPRKAENFWIPKNRQYMMSIGGHDFYH